MKTTLGYDAAQRGPESAAGRLINECSALRFLAAPSQFGPNLLAADLDVGVLVLEDLGNGPSLIDALHEPRRPDAQAALNAYARGLGHLHAGTRARQPESSELRSDPFVHMLTARNVPPLRSVVGELGLSWSDQAEGELQRVLRGIAEPGQWDALSQGDTCPENHRLTGDSVRFLDFEYCGFRHALLDAAFLRVPFPTCQDVQRLPADAVSEALAIYRSEAALDDETFDVQLDLAHAWWTMLSLGGYLPGALAADRTIGSATMRQRLLLWLETFSRDARSLPMLTALARDLLTLLRPRWPVEDLPTYPAFR